MTFHLAATIADVLAPALSGGGRRAAATAGDGGPSWAPRPEVRQTGPAPPGASAAVHRRPAMGATHGRQARSWQRISELAAEEQRLEEAHVGEGLSDEELARKRELEVTLDQLWDVLRQRRAKRNAGQDPDAASARPAEHGRGLPAVAPVGGYGADSARHRPVRFPPPARQARGAPGAA